MAGLKKYNEKRKFDETPEPKGTSVESAEKNRFVIQKHMARREHYDFRLQVGDVLVSWAIPKKPVEDPSVKRLAMKVEDHPLNYIHFEGNIPAGNYGAGTVMVWDIGYYYLDEEKIFPDKHEMMKRLDKGSLKLYLQGTKLRGFFNLVHSAKNKGDEWFFMKAKASGDADDYEERSAVSGRSMDEIAASSATWESNREIESHAMQPARVADEKAPEETFPGFVKPMLASLTDQAFSKDDWIFELKLDGYRVLAGRENERAILYSRRGNDYSDKYRLIGEEISAIKARFLIDGEVCYVGQNQKSDFQKLQHNFEEQDNLHYYVFDILWLNGHDLKSLPLLERKKLLQVLLAQPPPHIHYLEHREKDGEAYFREAEERGLEGIIAKKADGKYIPGERTKEWLKVKTGFRQEMIICGYTTSDKAGRLFKSLLCAVSENGSVVYTGRVGTGFNDALMKEISRKIKPLETEKPPVENPPRERNIHWVKPEIVCEVKFTEWTQDRVMRHPRFIGLRSDKEPEQIKIEEPVPVEDILENEGPADHTSSADRNRSQADMDREKTQEEKPNSKKTSAGTRRNGSSKESKSGQKTYSETGSAVSGEATRGSQKQQESKVKLTHLNKLYWKEEKLTKKDVIDYYRDLSEIILPYLKDRPQSLYRTPNGTGAKGFFQKNMKETAPDWAKTIELESGKGETIEYLLCQDTDTLLYMANLGCIEINPWSSSLPDLDHPDYMIFDLDPVDVEFGKVVELALKFRELFDQLGLPAFCKTSGSRGMHIYVPVQQRYSYAQIQAFVKSIESHIHLQNPELTSFERSPSERKGKVYFDYLQNAKGKTMAAVYSLRPRPGALVSAPVRWEELTPKLTPQLFTLRNMRKRLEKEGDLWQGIFEQRADIEKTLRKIEG
jgi:bifunctional non-homologous end joining protein LigD